MIINKLIEASVTIFALVHLSHGISIESRIRPSIIDIKQLELLYTLGSQETNELIRLARIPMQSSIATGKFNISQQIKESEARVAASPGANSDCAKTHAETLSEKVQPDSMEVCSYYETILTDALNRWNAVKSHIFFCSISSTNTCVDEIKEEIKSTKAINAEKIPEAPNYTNECRYAYCDQIAQIIAGIDKAFTDCLLTS